MPADLELSPYGDSLNAVVEKPKEKPDNGEMKLEDLESFLDDVRSEVPWRKEAVKCGEYYDGNQIDMETSLAMEEKGLPKVVVNLIKPTIDVVLGMEVKTRTDWVVKAEDEEHFETAKALTVKLKEAEKSSKADRACADAYASQVKAGVGWVEVSRNSDPFKYPYRCKQIPRTEIWWDMKDNTPLLEEARWLIRKQWYDMDALIAFMPDKKELIRAAYNHFPNFDTELEQTESATSKEMIDNWDNSRRTTLEQTEWLDTDRKRVALYEVWYRHWVTGHVLRLPDGRVVEFDKSNEEHVAAVQSGMLELEPATFQKMRLAIWMGSTRIYDMASPYEHNDFPYVPFFGYREDKSGKPYGLIRAMIDPQDEVNARRAKMLWLLSSNQVIIDSDAVDDHDEVAENINKPDSYVILNEDRRNANAITVKHGSDLSQQQYNMLLESKRNVQESSGIFQEMLGRAGGGGQSGEAIKSLVEQGTTGLGEINDNYRDSREKVGELLLSLVSEDLSKQQNIEVNTRDKAGTENVTLLNVPNTDEFDNEFMDNDVSRLKASVTLADVTSTPTYRSHVLNELMRMTQSMPPEVQMMLLESIFEVSDLPNKNEVVEKIRALNGGNQEDLSEEEQAAMQEQQAQAQEQQQQMMDIQQRMIELEARIMEADAVKKEADAGKVIAETDLIESKANEIDAGLKQTTMTPQPEFHGGGNIFLE